jgi:hypothetical protein
MLFDNSPRDTGPRAATAEGRRAGQVLFDAQRSCDLYMRTAQILRNGLMRGFGAIVTGLSADGTIPSWPGRKPPTPRGPHESAKRSQPKSMSNLLSSKEQRPMASISSAENEAKSARSRLRSRAGSLAGSRAGSRPEDQLGALGFGRLRLSRNVTGRQSNWARTNPKSLSQPIIFHRVVSDGFVPRSSIEPNPGTKPTPEAPARVIPGFEEAFACDSSLSITFHSRRKISCFSR